MNFYTDASDEQKKSYLHLLIQISKADNKIHQNEARFIDDMARRLGISEEVTHELLDLNKNVDLSLPKDVTERMRMFYHMLFLIGIDGEITEDEKEICKELGFRLCLNPPLMDDLIDIMVENLNKNVPEDKMVEAVIKYMN